MPAAAPTDRDRAVLGDTLREFTGKALELLAAIGEGRGAFAVGEPIRASARPAYAVAGLGIGVKQRTTRIGIDQPMRIRISKSARLGAAEHYGR
jgi:hypothetical protein